MAEDFQNRIKTWGAQPSYAFVAKPETNCVIEHIFRTFKEQAAHGRIFQTIDDFRAAVRDFVRRCNAGWLIEKIGQLSPDAMREKCNRDASSRAAQRKSLSKEAGAVDAEQLETHHLLDLFGFDESWTLMLDAVVETTRRCAWDELSRYTRLHKEIGREEKRRRQSCHRRRLPSASDVSTSP